MTTHTDPNFSTKLAAEIDRRLPDTMRQRAEVIRLEGILTEAEIARRELTKEYTLRMHAASAKVEGVKRKLRFEEAMTRRILARKIRSEIRRGVLTLPDST